MTTFNENARDWLADKTAIATDDLVITPLSGVNSSTVLAVGNARNIRAPRFVLRIFTDAEWLSDEPDLAAHEAAALREAARCLVDSPALVAFEANDIGWGGPVVLMSHLPGSVELQPLDLRKWSGQLAGTLAQIHAHKAPSFDWNYRNWTNPALLQVPIWATKPQLWERAIELWNAGAPSEKPVFLHRDYHPCNVLWQNERISGVVDWVNACRGPRGVDVAHCRIDLAVLFGVEVADDFRDAYLAVAGGTHHPFWDVNSILDMSLPQPEFYRPWSEFGLQEISVEEMGGRNEVYLQSVMERV